MKKYIRNPLILGLLVWIVLIVVLNVAAGHISNSPEGAVERLAQALSSGKDSEILKSYTSGLKEEYQMYSSWGEKLNVRDILGIEEGKYELLVQKVDMDEEDPDIATVVCIMIASGGDRENEEIRPLQFQLQRENGKWLVRYN